MKYLDLTIEDDLEPTYSKGQKIAGTIAGFVAVAVACFAILDAVRAMTV